MASGTIQQAGSLRPVPGALMRFGPISPVVLLLGVVALVTWALGGFNEADRGREAAVAELGQPITIDPFTVTVLEAGWASKLPTFDRAVDGERWLLLRIDATATVGEPVSQHILTQIVRLDAPTVSESQAPRWLLRAHDSLDAFYIQPTLSQPFVLAWQQSAAEPLPTRLEITLLASSFEPGQLNSQFGKYRTHPAFTVTVPVNPEEWDW